MPRHVNTLIAVNTPTGASFLARAAFCNSCPGLQLLFCSECSKPPAATCHFLAFLSSILVQAEEVQVMPSNCDVEGPKSNGRWKECSFPRIRWEVFSKKNQNKAPGHLLWSLAYSEYVDWHVNNNVPVAAVHVHLIWNIVWIMNVNVPTVYSGQLTSWWNEAKCSSTSHMTTFTSPIGRMCLWNYFTRSDGGRTTFSLQANRSRAFFFFFFWRRIETSTSRRSRLCVPLLVRTCPNKPHQQGKQTLVWFNQTKWGRCESESMQFIVQSNVGANDG